MAPLPRREALKAQKRGETRKLQEKTQPQHAKLDSLEEEQMETSVGPRL